MTKKQIKKYLKEARSKGWWIACLYWENKLNQSNMNTILDNQQLASAPRFKGDKK